MTGEFFIVINDKKLSGGYGYVVNLYALEIKRTRFSVWISQCFLYNVLKSKYIGN